MAKFKVGDSIVANSNVGIMVGKIRRVDEDDKEYPYEVDGIIVRSRSRESMSVMELSQIWCYEKDAYLLKDGQSNKAHMYNIPSYCISEDSGTFAWDGRLLQAVGDKFDWDAFKRGDVTVTFKTNESQKQFLKRCETHCLKWSSGVNPTTYSYGDSALGSRDGTLRYECLLDYRPMAYDWDARRYIKRSEKPNTDWTDEEITEAKELSRKLLCKIFDDGGSIEFAEYQDSLNIMFARFYHDDSGRTAMALKAKAAHDDKFNEWIGKCVCLCKATQTPIPSFILDKNKERK